MSADTAAVIGSIERQRTATTSRLRVLGARLSSTLLIGFVTGAVVGGVGGRIAMFILRLTSSPALRGLETDDGFTIGIVSGATMFLMGLTAFLGLLGALSYLAFRLWVPMRLRPWTAGVVAGLAGGAEFIRPVGIDFNLLAPLPLAIAMFVALPAAYGAVLALLVERSFRRPAGERWRSLAGLPLLLPLVFLGLRGTIWLGIALVTIATLWLFARRPALASIWTSAPVTWLGRIGLAIVTVLAGIALYRDVVTVL